MQTAHVVVCAVVQADLQADAQGGSRLVLASGATRPRAVGWKACAVVVVTLVTMVAGAIVLVASGARADSTSELVRLMNSARAARGLAPLTVSPDLAAAASRQAGSMASSGVLSHTPNLSGAVCCWSAVGENVGAAASVSAVQQAMMASPAHRANILSVSYTQVGVGVTVDRSGTLWVSEIFRKPNAPVPPAVAPTTVSVRPPAPPVRTTRAPAPPAPPPKASQVPAQPPAPPAAASGTPGGRASRDLAGGRLPPAAAARFAATLTSKAAAGADPVSRMLRFVAATAS